MSWRHLSSPMWVSFFTCQSSFWNWSTKSYLVLFMGNSRKTLRGKHCTGIHQWGELGWFYIKLKLRASFIMHIVRLLTYREGYVPKWVHFAVYWVGLHYREFCPDFVSNMKLHSLEYSPRFYRQCQLLFDEYMKDFGDNVDLKSLSLKIVYNNLLTKVFMPPLIVSKYPVKDFSPVWAPVNDNFLDLEKRTFAYRMAHNVMPTNFKLFIHGSGKDRDCTFCGKRFVETPKHLFAECCQAAPVCFFCKVHFGKCVITDKKWMKI